MKITKFIAEILTVMVAMAGGGKSTIALGEPPPLPIQSVYFSFSPVKKYYKYFKKHIFNFYRTIQTILSHQKGKYATNANRLNTNTNHTNVTKMVILSYFLYSIQKYHYLILHHIQ